MLGSGCRNAEPEGDDGETEGPLRCTSEQLIRVSVRWHGTQWLQEGC